MGKTQNLGHLAHIVAYNAENHITVPAGITMHTNQLVASQSYVTTALSSYALSSSLSSYVPTSRTITINGTTFDLSANRTFTIAAGLSSFNTRTGDVTLTSSDVTTALGFTPVTNARTITINGTAYDLSANREWNITSMIYPAAGIALSTGSAWGTSITNNSANWNTAYGWGNHASAGYLTGITSTQVTTALGFTPYNSTNPAGYITGISFANVSSKPTTLSGYGITDALGYISFTDSVGLNDNKLYLRTKGDDNHYIWNAADDWEEIVAYSGTGLRIKSSTGTTLATFSTSGNSMNINGNATTAGGLAVHTGRNNAANQIVRTDVNGYIQAGYINSTSGNENNNTNADRVWGTNGSDDYLRTYRTSALKVDGALKFWATTHPNDYYLVNNWTGSHWYITSNHPSPVRVGYADYAASAGYSDAIYWSGSQRLYGGSDGTRNTGWAYHMDNGTGLHWPNNGWHIMPASSTDFRIHSGNSSESCLRMETSGTTRGYVYVNSSNQIGFLNNDRSWVFKISNDGNIVMDYNYGVSITGVYSSTRYQGVWSMGNAYRLPADGTSTGNLYGLAWSHPNAGGVAGNLNDHGLLVINNGVFAAAISSSIRAAADMRAPIFYDSQDTGYYLDPNSESNLNRFTSATMTRNAMNYLSINSPIGTRAAQGGPYQNGTMGWGTVDFNTVFSNWGSGFIDTWSSPGNAPGGSSHYVGLQSCHYNHQNSANVYGFQMACAGEADNRFFWRSAWPGIRGWVEMVHSGNILSFSTSGNSANTIVRRDGNGDIAIGTLNTNHAFFGGGGRGLTSADTYGSYGNVFTYGTGQNGYSGYGAFDASGYRSFFMWEGGNGGIYMQSRGKWELYYFGGNDCTAITGSETYDWVRVCSNGKHRITNDSWCDATSWAYTFSNISDGRLKENIVTVDSALDKVLQLRGVYYNWIIDTENKKHIGLIAQETAAVCPEVVNYHDETDTYSVNYSELSGLFVESTKELNQKLMDANARIELLETKLNELLNA